MTYILDGVRESREDGCVYLCIDVFEPLETVFLVRRDSGQNLKPLLRYLQNSL